MYATAPLPRAGLRRLGVGRSRRVRLCVWLCRPTAAVGQAAQAYARARHLLHHEGGATLRARLGQRAIPGHEVALGLGVVGTAKEDLAPPRPLLAEIPAAAGTGACDAQGKSRWWFLQSG